MFEGTWREPDYLGVVGDMVCRYCDARCTPDEMASRNQCRACEKARKARYYMENREDYAARKAAWRAANRERAAETQRAYRERLRRERE